MPRSALLCEIDAILTEIYIPGWTGTSIFALKEFISITKWLDNCTWEIDVFTSFIYKYGYISNSIEICNTLKKFFFQSYRKNYFAEVFENSASERFRFIVDFMYIRTLTSPMIILTLPIKFPTVNSLPSISVYMRNESTVPCARHVVIMRHTIFQRRQSLCCTTSGKRMLVFVMFFSIPIHTSSRPPNFNL